MNPMYAPAHFREERAEVLRDAIHKIAFATLVTGGEGAAEANHIPLLLTEGTLSGHFARANPVWKTLAPGAPGLAIFMGPHFYASPSWYPSKAQTGKGVPTWNYISVQVRGTLTLHEDSEWLCAHVSALAHEHEHFRSKPWTVEEAPADYIQSLLKVIVGFELSITGIEGAWKMSQNRPAGDVEGIKEALIQEGRDDLARLMDKG